MDLDCSDMASIGNYIPRGFGYLKKLKKLKINLGTVRVLPEQISELPKLEELTVRANNDIIISEVFCNLQSLHSISLELSSETFFIQFPPSFGHLPRLKTMTLERVCHASFRNNDHFPHVKKLTIYNEFNGHGRRLPDLSTRFPNLNELYSGPSSSLPSDIGYFTKLKKLDLSYCFSSSLPPSIVNLKNLTVLICYDSRVAIDDTIGGLVNLEILDLGCKRITRLPLAITKLKKLKILVLFGTPIAELPDDIGDLTNLQELDLRRTRIETLPSSIAKLTNLRLLYLTREMLEDQSETNLEMISTLIDHLPRLGCLGFSELNHGHRVREYKPQTPETLSFIPRKLMRNRLRARIASLNATDGTISFPVAAWPLVLKQHAVQFTRRYDCGYYNDHLEYSYGDDGLCMEHHNDYFCWCCGYKPIELPSCTHSDAIFRLLRECGPEIVSKGQVGGAATGVAQAT